MARKKRSLKGRKDKITKVVELQDMEGKPLDEDPEKAQLRMTKKKAKKYDKTIQTVMKTQGLESEEEALNHIIEQGLGESEVKAGLNVMGESRLSDDKKSEIALSMTSMGLLGLANPMGLMGLANPGSAVSDIEYADPAKRHLLEPGAEALLESEIAKYMMRSGASYKEAREHVLTNGDRMMDESDYIKLINHYEKHGDIEPEKLVMLKDLHRKTKKKNDALRRSAVWFKALNRLKKLNRSAKSLLQWIGCLHELPKWNEADEIEPIPEAQEAYRQKQIERLSQCRIFEVDALEASVMLTKILEHMYKMLDIETPRKFTKEEESILNEKTKEIGFPDLPYPNTFVGFGVGFHAEASVPDMGLDQIHIQGIIYSRGEIDILYTWEDDSKNFPSIPNQNMATIYHGSSWEQGGSPELAWLAVALIDTINAHRTVVLEGASLSSKDERHLKKLARILDLKMLPHAFYSAELKNRIYFNQIKRLAPIVSHRRAMTYRTDRRAHERCRVQRGPIPRTDEERLEFKHLKKKLLGYGYTVYEDQPMSVHDKERLMVRGMRLKQPNEWLAVLAYGVRETIVGPPEAPYIPRVDVIKRLDPVNDQT